MNLQFKAYSVQLLIIKNIAESENVIKSPKLFPV